MYNYLWSNGATTESITVTHNAPSLTPYYVTVTDACGQVKKDTVTVKINAPSTASLSCPKTDICPNEKTPLIFNFIGDTPYEYIYSIDGVGQKKIITSKKTDTIFVSKSGTYKLVSLNNNLCSTVTGEVKIKEIAKIALNLAPSKTIGCLVDSVEIGTSPNPLYQYSWSNGSKKSSQTVKNAVTYYVTVLDIQSKCSFMDSVKVLQNKERPRVVINTKSAISCKDEKVQIDALGSSQGKQFLYEWRGEKIENGQKTLNPTVLKEGIYVLKITDTKNGCFSKDSINVAFCRPKIYAPNIFSPNDDGRNDNFTLFADTDISLKINRLQIYNRWGNLIFDKTDFNLNQTELGWDGTFRGQPVPKGLYTWTADILLIDNSVKQLSGEILVF